MAAVRVDEKDLERNPQLLAAVIAALEQEGDDDLLRTHPRLAKMAREKIRQGHKTPSGAQNGAVAVEVQIQRKSYRESSEVLPEANCKSGTKAETVETGKTEADYLREALDEYEAKHSRTIPDIPPIRAVEEPERPVETVNYIIEAVEQHSSRQRHRVSLPLPLLSAVASALIVAVLLIGRIGFANVGGLPGPVPAVSPAQMTQPAVSGQPAMSAASGNNVAAPTTAAAGSGVKIKEVPAGQEQGNSPVGNPQAANNGLINVKIVSVSADSITVSWDSVPGAAYYKVSLEGSAKDSNAYKFFQTTSTTYTFTNVGNSIRQGLLVGVMAYDANNEQIGMGQNSDLFRPVQTINGKVISYPWATGSYLPINVSVTGPAGTNTINGKIDSGACITAFPDTFLRGLGYQPVSGPVNVTGVGSGPLPAYTYEISYPAAVMDSGQVVPLGYGTLKVWGIQGWTDGALIGPDVLARDPLDIHGDQWTMTVPGPQ